MDKPMFCVATLRGKTAAIVISSMYPNGVSISGVDVDNHRPVIVPMWYHGESEGRVCVTIGSAPLSRRLSDATADEMRRTVVIPSSDIQMISGEFKI